MLPGIHKRRAAKGYEDLSSKYPGPAAGQMCVAVEVVERAFSSAEATEARGRMLVDSMASVDLVHDIDMFDAATLAPCTGKQVRVASGQVLSATHTGTLLLVACDTDGVWRAVRREGAWLVPGLTANLLSVRAGKSLGCNLIFSRGVPCEHHLLRHARLYRLGAAMAPEAPGRLAEAVAAAFCHVCLAVEMTNRAAKAATIRQGHTA